MGGKETKLLDQSPYLPIPEDNYRKEKFYIKENINIYFVFLIIFIIILIIFIIFLNNKKSKWR